MENKLNMLKKKLAILLDMAKPTPRQGHTYKFPTLDLLEDYSMDIHGKDMDCVVIEEKMQEFGLGAQVVHVRKGPMVTRY